MRNIAKIEAITYNRWLDTVHEAMRPRLELSQNSKDDPILYLDVFDEAIRCVVDFLILGLPFSDTSALILRLLSGVLGPS